MGDYTELNISVRIKVDDETKKLLNYMTGKHTTLTVDDISVPNHPLFSSPRWEYMLNCESAYFDHVADSALYGSFYSEDYYLNVRCDLKNYGDEIENFLDWIHQFTITRGFIGYMRFEREEEPTLIYFTDNGVKYRLVK